MAQMGTGSSQMSSPKLKHYSSYHQLDWELPDVLPKAEALQ